MHLVGSDQEFLDDCDINLESCLILNHINVPTTANFSYFKGPKDALHPRGKYM